MKKADFFNSVYVIVGQIPKGKVMTYGQIAALMGMPKCSRRVGQAMCNTPEYPAIPAHRVVNSKGELAPPHVFGGTAVQKKILEDEGVLFKQNGCIDLKKSVYRWSNMEEGTLYE